MFVTVTTWIDNINGGVSMRYVYAGLVNDVLHTSEKKYSTAEGARKAAVRAGHTPIKGVAQGHANALICLQRFLLKV